MSIESKERGIPFNTQVRLPVYYKGQLLEKAYITDYIGYEKIIVEIKCISHLSSTEEAQVINYLKATGLWVGLLINFGSKGKLEWKRYIY